MWVVQEESALDSVQPSQKSAKICFMHPKSSLSMLAPLASKSLKSIVIAA